MIEEHLAATFSNHTIPKTSPLSYKTVYDS